jgi:MOSC domain-containing protein YiiM
LPEGTLHSINVSNGGVPKTPRTSADVRVGGVEGDRQRDLRYHGGPDRAVSLYSLDLIRALQAEGHPITVGSIGENLTLAGLDWAALAAGARIDVGDVLLEITKPAPPCEKIAGSFRDGDFVRVSQKVHPGWSRFYCRVLREGHIRAGDRVALSSGRLC